MASLLRGWLECLFGRERVLPTVPPGMRVYAVGDIHGCADLLTDLLEKIRADAKQSAGQNILIFLGDYVDRGPDSKAVIDQLLQLQWTDWEFIFLRGNHDQAVLQFAADANFYRSWRDFGGGETLRSYGVKPPLFDKEDAFAEAQRDFIGKCPPQHFEFFRSLKYLDIVGDYVFVHAGLRPGLALDRQTPEDLLWIRDEFLNYDGLFEKIVVHGHTPSRDPVRRSNRIGVDTGAYATDCLTAAVLVGENCTFLKTQPVAQSV